MEYKQILPEPMNYINVKDLTATNLATVHIKHKNMSK